MKATIHDARRVLEGQQRAEEEMVKQAGEEQEMQSKKAKQGNQKDEVGEKAEFSGMARWFRKAFAGGAEHEKRVRICRALRRPRMRSLRGRI